MLTLAGFLTIGVILALLLTSRVTAVVALAGVPIAAALLSGFSPSEIGKFAADGIRGVAPTATMFVFAIVFFGVMRDAGLFDPIVRRIVRLAGNAPVTVCAATTALAVVAHLDGAGATTFLIAIPAMLPVFDRLGMSRLVLATCVGLGAGVMNIMPWGGPTARAATTSGVPANDLWVPLIPAQIAGIIVALLFAAILGRREQRRITAAGGPEAFPEPVDADEGTERTAKAPATSDPTDLDEAEAALRRPKLFWFNVALTIVAVGSLVFSVSTPELIFLVGVVIALIVNYPGLKAQTARIEAHAHGAMLMASTLLAAGVFLGVLDGSTMIEQMAQSAANVIASGAAPALPLIAGVAGVPLSLFFGPDAYYFGVLPVLIGIGDQFGVAGVDIARASIVGQETVGFPISPMTGSFYLLVGLAGVNIGRHIRHLFFWAWAASLVMLAVAILTGAVPLWAA